MNIRTTTGRRGWSLVLGIVVMSALLDIAQSLNGDQSTFLIGAHAMHDGAVLYRDFCEIKQPAVYIFYYMASAFGDYSAFRVHVFELLYMVAFACTLIVAANRLRTFSRVAVLIPITVVASYYLGVGSYEAIQVESLVGFPLFLTAWLFAEGANAGRFVSRALLFAGGGFCAVIALSFKLLFLPIVGVMLLVSLFCSTMLKRPKAHVHIGIAAAAALIGGAIPALAILGYFYSQGALNDALAAWFVMPPRVVAAVPHQSLTSLVAGLRWFVNRFGGLCAMAGFGLYVAVRRGPDQLALALFSWIVVGVGVIIVQVTSWYQYQWLLILPPIGAFAALGARYLIDRATRSANTSGRLIPTLVLLTCAGILPGTLILAKVRMLAMHSFAFSKDSREAFRRAESPIYRGSLMDASLIPRRDGDLYVIGNPTFYTVTNHLQPVAINGSSIQLLLPEQWRELQREFLAKPPRYVYISHAVYPTIALRSPTFFRFLTSGYSLTGQGILGDVYTLRSSQGRDRVPTHIQARCPVS